MFPSLSGFDFQNSRQPVEDNPGRQLVAEIGKVDEIPPLKTSITVFAHEAVQVDEGNAELLGQVAHNNMIAFDMFGGVRSRHWLQARRRSEYLFPG